MIIKFRSAILVVLFRIRFVPLNLREQFGNKNNFQLADPLHLPVTSVQMAQLMNRSLQASRYEPAFRQAANLMTRFVRFKETNEPDPDRR